MYLIVEKVNRILVSFPFLCWRVELTSSHCELPCQDATWRCTPERTLFTDSFAFYKAHEPLPLHKPVILTRYKIFFTSLSFISFWTIRNTKQFWHSIDIYITDDKIINFINYSNTSLTCQDFCLLISHRHSYFLKQKKMFLIIKYLLAHNKK